ncbi:50S ribosomal protein L21 [Candidatus Gottesmanbacteria bacterium RBG_16_43_7]|uniref:Large ribosomal subunit protein bL21 n=1 Tax=Candidatus Gottesmanbacteria bacterium RBG_16_43_7 TaxID=1798373 RepID=A0A1F5Z896_9BACT|nr:MAG: 50S ribosomal protein L21 [Candidatus Gottesmanbacteria bacterium RBG_16_43_7]
MLAVVKIAGKQYKVTLGDTIVVDHIDGDVGMNQSFTDVYLVKDDKSIKIGTPTVKGYSVVANISRQLKGEKIHVRRYKSKVRYRKHIGFRPHLTELTVEKIKNA